ncbi:chorismate mutase aro7 [Tilletia horrida]|nr:chorismate mutase aro7 [Tilletia horrida]
MTPSLLTFLLLLPFLSLSLSSLLITPALSLSLHPQLQQQHALSIRSNDSISISISNAAPTNPFLNPSANPADLLNLTLIRTVLEHAEDRIISAIIERSQYAYDARLYSSPPNSTLDWFLARQEALLALTGQWELPDQVPFTSRARLPAPVYPVPTYPSVLHSAAANFSRNHALKKAYLNSTLPSLNLPPSQKTGGPNPALGPTLHADTALLHLLSSRIHLGRYVAESKYASNTSLYAQPIASKNLTALNALITNTTVEEANVVRVQSKAGMYGDGAQAQAVGALYRDVLIPLTKEVEVGYLLGRLS